jgi:hypothetical protein
VTEEQARKAKAQDREFPETMELLKRVRDALAAQVFRTPLSASAQREDLYTRVQALDALKPKWRPYLASNAGEKAIEAYAEELAKPAKK